jgi:hypothetical protein
VNRVAIIVAGIWAWYWLNCGAWELANSSRFGWDIHGLPAYSIAMDLLLGIALSSFACLLWFAGQNMSKTRMSKAQIMVVLPLFTFSALVSPLLLASSLRSFLQTTACVADLAGQHELAERLFAVCSGSGKSVATWQTAFRREKQYTRQLRNTAVAEVYGEQSLQMAERFYFVAINLEMTAGRNQPYPSEALDWLNRSLKIFREHVDSAGVAKTQEQIALVEASLEPGMH